MKLSKKSTQYISISDINLKYFWTKVKLVFIVIAQNLKY